MKMAFVPQNTSRSPDKIRGEHFTYGGYEVTLAECPKDGYVFANLEAHNALPVHKAAVQIGR